MPAWSAETQHKVCQKGYLMVVTEMLSLPALTLAFGHTRQGKKISRSSWITVKETAALATLLDLVLNNVIEVTNTGYVMLQGSQPVPGWGVQAVERISRRPKTPAHLLRDGSRWLDGPWQELATHGLARHSWAGWSYMPGQVAEDAWLRVVAILTQQQPATPREDLLLTLLTNVITGASSVFRRDPHTALEPHWWRTSYATLTPGWQDDTAHAADITALLNGSREYQRWLVTAGT